MTVESSGPPPVITYGSVNTCMVATICISIMISSTNLVCGIVTCRRRCHRFAPSSSAASYSSPGIVCSAAR